MNDEDFKKLVESIEQAGAIRAGNKKASRRTKIKEPDPKQIRESLGLSQSDFALLIGVSARTIQNWEQHRREPEGAAKALLRVTAKNPDAVLEALHN
jgi:putative transcriptional regulator